MDSKKISVNVFCPMHPSENVQRIDLNPLATQRLYCVECILNQDNPSMLQSKLKTITDFIGIASEFYASSQRNVKITESPPSDYQDLIAQQGEKLERLNHHVNQEKDRVEAYFAKILEELSDLLNQKKQIYLQALDQQLFKLQAWFISFEKQFRKTYPTAEDMTTLFPSRETLINRIQKITNCTQLEAFIKTIQEDLTEQKLSGEDQENYLRSFARKMTQVEYTRPQYGEVDVSSIRLQIDKRLQEALDKIFVLKEKVLDVNIGKSGVNSEILTSVDLELIKSWVDYKYKADFAPKLLYRASTDGKQNHIFHQRCDGKGPTLTVVKCQFDGSSNASIIGGFLDQSWHSENANIHSDKAFIFSLTKQIKCGVINPKCAGYGGENHGPSFGAANDLLLKLEGPGSCVHPYVFYESGSLVDKPKFFGGYAYFQIIDIEVYQL